MAEVGQGRAQSGATLDICGDSRAAPEVGVYCLLEMMCEAAQSGFELEPLGNNPASGGGRAHRSRVLWPNVGVPLPVLGGWLFSSSSFSSAVSTHKIQS